MLTNKLFVANLPFSVNENELDVFFAQAGEVVSSRIVRDRESGESRGFGFVEMFNAEQAEKAIQKLDGLKLNAGS